MSCLAFDVEDLPENGLQYGAIYDLHGHRCDFSSLRAGIKTADLRYLDETDSDHYRDHDPHLNDPDVRRLWIVILRLLIVLNYIRSGRFTPIQLRMIYLAWIHEFGLRDIARLENKAPSVVGDRFNGTKGYGGLEKKAPEFWGWWAPRNAKYQREGGKKGRSK